MHPPRPEQGPLVVPEPASPAPAPGEHRRNGRLAGLQLILAIALFVIVEVLVAIIAYVWGLVAHGTVASEAMPGPFDPVGFLVASVVGAALAVAGHLLIVGPLGGRPGLAMSGRGKLAEFAAGLVLGTALITISTGVIALLGGYRVTGVEPHPQLLVPLAIGIVASFVEEVFFRGALLRILDGWLGSWAALAITSVLFGLIHISNDGAGPWGALAITVEASILLGGAYLLTRRLWLAVGLHLAWNTVQAGVFSFAVSGTGAQRGLLRAELEGPAWLNGGAMGVEGSVVTVCVGLAAGIVLLVLAHRRGHLLPRDRRRPAPEAETPTAG